MPGLNKEQGRMIGVLLMFTCGRGSSGEPHLNATATEEIVMAFYLIQAVYKDTAAKWLIMHPQTREDDIGKTCKSLGGKLHSLFFAFGEYDVVAIANCPIMPPLPRSRWGSRRRGPSRNSIPRSC